MKLRKERTLARSEYADVRDRIEDLRSRARGESRAALAASSSAVRRLRQPATHDRAPALPRRRQRRPTSHDATARRPDVEIPVGHRDRRAAAERAELGDRAGRGSLRGDDARRRRASNGRVVIPAGSVMRGVVTAVEPATRTNRTARMTVSFDQVTVNGRAYPIRGTVTQAIEGEGIKGETARIGAGAGVGAIIGGILGGFKGALAGILIGGGGTIAATEGKEVELPQGSVLRVRLDSPVQISTAR